MIRIPLGPRGREIVASLAAAVVGAAFGLQLAMGSAAHAHLDGLVHVKAYTYGANCLTGDETDPVSVVFYSNASAPNVKSHAAIHGSWTTQGGYATDQYFYQHGCRGYSGSAADDSEIHSRYHLRLVDQSPDPGEVWLGTYSLSTPHRDSLVTCGWIPKHSVHVPSTEWQNAPSGFVAGKWQIDWLWTNWNNGGREHYYQGSQYWGNTTQIRQCDGVYAWNDGWVDFIQVQ